MSPNVSSAPKAKKSATKKIATKKTQAKKSAAKKKSQAKEPDAQPLVADIFLSALARPESARALTEVAIDYLFELPIGRYLDLELLVKTTREAYKPQALKALVMRVLPQVIERWRDYTDTTPLTPIGDWLTPELDAELRAFVMRAQVLSPERVQRWAHHPLTRHITRAFVEETLERFIQRVKPGGDGGGVLGAASRGALGWAQRASRGVLGGVAEQLQSQLTSLTSDFIAASMTPLLDQLAVIMNTPEVARLTAEAQLRGYSELTQRSIAELIHTVQRELPTWDESQIDEWTELGSEWVEHFISLPEVSKWVTELQEQLVTDLGDQSLRSLVGGEEPAQAMRQALIDTLSPHVIEMSQSPTLRAWCLEHL